MYATRHGWLPTARGGVLAPVEADSTYAARLTLAGECRR
jgi:hypothetical protein